MHVLTPILETIETIIDSFSKDNSDGTKNIKEAIGLLTKTTTWHVHQAFFVHFPAITTCLYDLKCLKSSFMENINKRLRL